MLTSHLAQLRMVHLCGASHCIIILLLLLIFRCYTVSAHGVTLNARKDTGRTSGIDRSDKFRSHFSSVLVNCYFFFLLFCTIAGGQRRH